MIMYDLDRLMNEVTKEIELKKELEKLQEYKLVDEIICTYEKIKKNGIIEEILTLIKFMGILDCKIKFQDYEINRLYLQFSGYHTHIKVYREGIKYHNEKHNCVVEHFSNDRCYTSGNYPFDRRLRAFSNKELMNIQSELNDFINNYCFFRKDVINQIVQKLSKMKVQNEELLKQLNLMKTRVITITITEEDILTHQI